jgi:hypothetical protein
MKAKYELDRLMRNDTLGCTLLACLLVGVFGGALLV